MYFLNNLSEIALLSSEEDKYYDGLRIGCRLLR